MAYNTVVLETLVQMGLLKMNMEPILVRVFHYRLNIDFSSICSFYKTLFHLIRMTEKIVIFLIRKELTINSLGFDPFHHFFMHTF